MYRFVLHQLTSVTHVSKTAFQYKSSFAFLRRKSNQEHLLRLRQRNHYELKKHGLCQERIDNLQGSLITRMILHRRFITLHLTNLEGYVYSYFLMQKQLKLTC